jgi:hypothetical protein
MLSATIMGLPAALVVSTLPGPGLGKAAAVALLLLPLATAPLRRPWADADEFLSSLAAKLVGELVQRASAPVPLTDVQVALATPAELSAAMATEAETSAPSSDPRAAPEVDLGVPTAAGSNCPIASASQDAPSRQVATGSPLVGDDDLEMKGTVADYRDSRARASILQTVDPAAIAALATRQRPVSFTYRQQIYGEGEPGDQLYMINSGKVKLGRRRRTAATI